MTGNCNVNISVARRRIARIRCLQDCIKSLRNRKPFPECLCYIPSEIEYTVSVKSTWKLFAAPQKVAKIVKEISATTASRLVASGEDLCNSDGKWLRVLRVKVLTNEEYETLPGNGAWLLLFSSRSSTEETPAAVPVQDNNTSIGRNKTIYSRKQIPRLRSWEAVVEETYSPVLKKHRAEVVPADQEAVTRLNTLERDWTLEHDAALVQLMSQNVPQETENLGCLRGFVEAIDVSS
uniref:Uncharacterized protein n=1 Tax=Arion vulgaris TaxID=1028688 RepID=A0A0B6ZXH7_9EUPU